MTCQFNETDEYVLYYHGGRKTLRVFRVSDGCMIANYKVPSNLISIDSTSDGNSVALGMLDGTLIILTIADPMKKQVNGYLKTLPSRNGFEKCVTFEPRLGNIVKVASHVDSLLNKLKSNIQENADDGEG